MYRDSAARSSVLWANTIPELVRTVFASSALGAPRAEYSTFFSVHGRELREAFAAPGARTRLPRRWTISLSL